MFDRVCPGAWAQVVFSSSEDLDCGEQQSSLIPTVEEVVQEEEGQGEDAGSEQQFGVFKDFDFLDVELEDTEVSVQENYKHGGQSLPRYWLDAQCRG